MFNRSPEKKAEREAELQRRRDAYQLKQRRDDFEIHGYRYDHGSGGYGITNNPDGSITVGDPLFGYAVTMQFPGAVGSLSSVPRTAPLLAFKVLGPPPFTVQYYLTVRSAGIEATIPVDGTNAPYQQSFVAAFNTAAARAATVGSLPEDAMPPLA